MNLSPCNQSNRFQAKLGKRYQEKKDKRRRAEATMVHRYPAHRGSWGTRRGRPFRPRIPFAGRMPTVHGRHHSCATRLWPLLSPPRPGLLPRATCPQESDSTRPAAQRPMGPMGPEGTVPFLRRYGIYPSYAINLRFCHWICLFGQDAEMIGHGYGAFLSPFKKNENSN